MDVESYIQSTNDAARDIASTNGPANDLLPINTTRAIFLSELYLACMKFGVKTGPEAAYTDFRGMIHTIRDSGGFAQLGPVISKVYSNPEGNSFNNLLLRLALVDACYGIFRTLPSLDALDTLSKVPSFCNDIQEYATYCSSQASSAGTPASEC